MKDSKGYYIALDILRVMACIAILFYHLNFLKGGYLAVCSFLVLSSYLAVISASKRNKFSFKDYYLSRLKKIYLPLLIIVFITIAVISFIPNIVWLNLKPETTSVLLGYNNFWQLSANLDYFARHVSSPFMHLWYIAILMQFEIVFPFIYVLMKKIGDKVHKIIPSIVFSILFLGGFIYFYYSFNNSNLMVTYYSTFTRMFALFLGVAIGFWHIYYDETVCFKKRMWINIIYVIYLIFLVGLFIGIDSSSKLMPIGMILTSLITWRLIEYSRKIDSNNSFLTKIIKTFASISYEVYLWQYPLIYIVGLYIDNLYILSIVVIILTIILAYILHFALNNKNEKYKVIRIIVLVILIVSSIYGAVRYIISKDYTEEMNALEEQLANNSKILEEKQKAYAEQMQKDADEFAVSLDNLNISEEELKLKITNLNIVGIGDSVMLGTINDLYKEFPNGYFDAKISRTAWVVNDILIALNNRHILGEPILLNLGANGDCPEECKEKIIATAGNRDIFWLNVTNDNEVHFNAKLEALASKYENIHIIDWAKASVDHPEYFVADGIHLTAPGRDAYTKTIYDAIYNAYLDKYQKQKDELIKDYEEKIKNKISFIGNDLLLNAYDYLKEDYPDSVFEINSNFNYEEVDKYLTKQIEDNTLTKEIVFIFDRQVNMTDDKWQKILTKINTSEVYIVLFDGEMISGLPENVKVLSLASDSENVMADKIHLTNKGNELLQSILKENLT